MGARAPRRPAAAYALIAGVGLLLALRPGSAIALEPSSLAAAVRGALAIPQVDPDVALDALDAAALPRFIAWAADGPAAPGLLPGPVSASAGSRLEALAWAASTVEPDLAQGRSAHRAQRWTDLATLAALWSDPASPALTAAFAGRALGELAQAADPALASARLPAQLDATALGRARRGDLETAFGLFGPRRSGEQVAHDVRGVLRARFASDLAALPVPEGLWSRPDPALEALVLAEVGEGVSDPQGTAFAARLSDLVAERAGLASPLVYSRAWREASAAPHSAGGPAAGESDQELRSMQRDTLVRAATAMLLWHRLFRTATDPGSAAAVVVGAVPDVDAARDDLVRRSRDALAAPARARLLLPAPPPSPRPSTPPADPAPLLALLGAFVGIGGWLYLVRRAAKRLGRSGWRAPASGAVLVLLSLGSAAPGVAAPAPRSPHEAALLRHREAPHFTEADVVGPTSAQIAARNDDGATVIGYLPYWVSPDNLPWDKLDIVAYFSVGVNADGSLESNDHGWGEASGDAFIEAAHLAGVLVTLSATRFGGSALAPLLSSATARAACISNLVARMIDGGGDGLDIDFEGLDVDNRQDMVVFIQDLRAAMDAAQPGSLLTLATPAIDWSGSWDYDLIANSSDYLFIMGYAFAGSWSNPQPNAPLDGGAPWGSRSLRWSVQDYVQWGGANNTQKIVLGLPLYGHDWETTGASVPGVDAGAMDTMFFDESRELAAVQGQLWEPVSATPYSTYQVGGQWHQMWFDDAASIGLKAQMAYDEGIGGFGFWALNYDDNDAVLWDGVQTVLDGWGGLPGDDDDDDDDDDDSGPGDDDDSTEPLLSPPVLDILGPAAVLVGSTVRLDARGTTDPDGLGLTWLWSSDEGPLVTLLAADTAQPSFVAESVGVVSVSVVVVDAGGESATGELLVRVVDSSDADGLPDDGAGCACASTVGHPFLQGSRRRLPLLLLLLVALGPLFARRRPVRA